MNINLTKLSLRCVPDTSMDDRIRYEVADNDLVLYSDCNDMMVHSFDIFTNNEVMLYVDDGDFVEFKDGNDARLDGLSLWVRTKL